MEILAFILLPSYFLPTQYLTPTPFIIPGVSILVCIVKAFPIISKNGTVYEVKPLNQYPQGSSTTTLTSKNKYSYLYMKF